LFSGKIYGRNVENKIEESNFYYGRKFHRNFGRNHCFFAQKNRPLVTNLIMLFKDEDPLSGLCQDGRGGQASDPAADDDGVQC
jgi:hypothetical protein